MTRINLVPPQELCDQHLLAEWRELTRIPNGIVSGKYVVNLAEIPEHYTVRTEDNPAGGRGHVKFFFNKLKFLHQRYNAIRQELARRRLPRQNFWPVYQFPYFHRHLLWQDYQPTPEAIALNRKRIAERMPKQPRYAGERI